MKKGAMVLLVFIFSCSFVNALLGLTPAVKELNYEPGKEIIIPFTVLSDNPNKTILLSYGADKEFNNSVILSKTEVRGEEGFIVTLRMPNSVETPGVHGISITAKEVNPSGGAIGTLIQISVSIKIRVPYPGKYIEASLSVPNGNINEEIPVELNLMNRGKEEVTARSTINFYTLGNLAQTKTLAIAVIKPEEVKTFNDFLNTNDLNAGNYEARAEIDYGGKNVATANANFRIGSLFVNVTNSTTFLLKGGIQKFFVDVESMWNDDLASVFADVNLSNASMIKPITFRTPSVDLKAWEKKRLEGFLDTTGLEGKYDNVILLSYGEGQTLVKGTLLIEKEKVAGYNLFVVGGIVAALILIVVLVVLFLKKRRALKRK